MRINIYVSPAMHALMQKRAGTNWSSIAQAAFQAELDKPVRDVLDVRSSNTPKNGKQDDAQRS